LFISGFQEMNVIGLELFDFEFVRDVMASPVSFKRLYHAPFLLSIIAFQQF